MQHRINKCVVIGLGQTGLSCVRYLLKSGYQVTVTDSRDVPPGLSELKTHFPNVVVRVGALDPTLIAAADTLIVSPGVALKHPVLAERIAQGIPAIGDIELFARAVDKPIVAITGSNGKSTVTSLLGEMARYAGLNVAVGGNIGVPVLDLLADNPAADLYVLELSSFQLETTHTLAAAAATVLNISEDHMDRYDSLADYIAAKQRIYQHARYIIHNRDDKNLSSPRQAKQINFGLTTPQTNEFGITQKNGNTYLAFGQQLLLDTQKMLLQGQHNWANALAALALGQAVKLPQEAMIQALQKFGGLVHRCQWLGNFSEVDWYNDSKGTNVGATQAAIEGLGKVCRGQLILIAGGQGKNADFSVLKEDVTRYVKHLILFGEDAKLLGEALANCAEIHYAKALEDTVIKAKQLAHSHDAVLFSPACASFDMFKNFEERGNHFMGVVKKVVS